MPKWDYTQRRWNGCLRKKRHEHWGTALAHFAHLCRLHPYNYYAIYPCAYGCGGIHVGKSRTLKALVKKLRKGLGKLERIMAHPNFELRVKPETVERLRTVRDKIRTELEEIT